MQGNWINVYGTLHFDPANVVFDGGEIFVHNNGIAYNNGTGSGSIYGGGSCISVKPGGRYITSNPGYQLNFADGALLLNDGGSIELSDNSKLIFEETSQKFKINPGSTIELGANARIEVNSQLDAQGSAFQPITITSLDQNPLPADYWKWIKLTGDGLGSQDDFILKYATIEYGEIGIYGYDAYVNVENCIVRKNDVANIWLSNCSGNIDQSTIENSDNGWGIRLQNSSPYISNCNILENADAGVYCHPYSSPRFYPDEGVMPAPPGNNVIANNQSGIRATYYSSPFLGSWDKEFGSIAGYNSIYGSGEEYYHVYANNNCDIDAQFNWWGQYPPDEELFYANENSTINYSNALDYDPNEGMIAKSLGGFLGNSNPQPLYSGRSGNGPDSLLRLARKYRYRQRPNLAIDVYKRLINNYPNSLVARWALIEILWAFKEARLDSSANFLQRIKATHSNIKMKRIAYDLLSGVFLEQGNVSAAISNAQEILTLYPNTSSEKFALFDLFNIFLNLQKDSTAAQNMLTVLEQKYPKDELTRAAQYQFRESGKRTLGLTAGNLPEAILETSPGESKSNTTDQVPEQFSLQQNYPNPFNPTTNIRFGMSELGFVELKIYDLTGRLVRTLISEIKEPGMYKVQWDGMDDKGNQAASGIYIYRMKTKEFIASRKLILLR